MPDRQPDNEETFRFLRGLPFRVVAFLSLALLPIGMLAVWQTKGLDETLRERTELSLVALTELAASGERRAIQAAVGSARTQAAMYETLMDDPERCRAALGNLVDHSSIYRFVGFIPVSGSIVCSSQRSELENSFLDQRVMALTESTVQSFLPVVIPDAEPSQYAVLLQPIFVEDTVIGQVAIAMPADVLSQQRDMIFDREPRSMVIYNQGGEIISAQGEPIAPDVIQSLVTPDQTGSIFDPQRRVIRHRTANDRAQLLTTTSLVPGVAYAVGSWSESNSGLGSSASMFPTFFLPALMWLASLLVAYFAVHRLVVAPVQDLQKRMRLFAVNRSLTGTAQTERLPTELFELEQTFSNMAYDLLDDEARMEDSLREKNVLLKEIHHRVKNNLQMISSIINMEVRASNDSFARDTLKRLQARIIGLATVHRYLYKSENLGRTDAAPLMEEICNVHFDRLAITHPGADILLEADSFSLIPDQAVPLALFVGEAGAQAIRKMPDPSDEAGVFHISLKIVAPGMAMVLCRSSCSDVPDDTRDTDSTIGQQLMRAFAMQLGNTIEITQTDGIRTVCLTFAVTTNLPDALDY
ncbi:sensor histidine kinase [Loktanella sp. SALINAS62]|uniref:sensor histidine kinase n=1 Tax=Loktanella sp. SALINAS62 TaxID=2706124 RepID=UPI001B8BBA7E|nr:sensor histidine kinase [Loktanella sp. SALINAS62]MBS1302235.1 sensor histidine kinase [Loktanella sp. SALINAS62]